MTPLNLILGTNVNVEGDQMHQQHPCSLTTSEQNRTEMIYLVDQDKNWRHNTFRLLGYIKDYSCSTGGCEGTGKRLRVKQPPRRLDAEASSKSNYTARATLLKRVSNHKKIKIMSVQASFSAK